MSDSLSSLLGHSTSHSLLKGKELCQKAYASPRLIPGQKCLKESSPWREASPLRVIQKQKPNYGAWEGDRPWSSVSYPRDLPFRTRLHLPMPRQREDTFNPVTFWAWPQASFTALCLLGHNLICLKTLVFFLTQHIKLYILNKEKQWNVSSSKVGYSQWVNI